MTMYACVGVILYTPACENSILRGNNIIAGHILKLISYSHNCALQDMWGGTITSEPACARDTMHCQHNCVSCRSPHAPTTPIFVRLNKPSFSIKVWSWAC